MNCHEFEELLQQHLNDGKPLSSFELVEHSSQCAVCQRQTEQLQTLVDAIAAWQAEPLEVHLADRVVNLHLRSQSVAPQAVAGADDDTPHLDRGVAFTRPVLPAGSGQGQLQRAARRSRRALVAGLASLGALVALTAFVSKPPGRFEHPDTSSRQAARARSAAEPPHVEVQTIVRHAGAAYWALARDTVGELGDATMLLPRTDQYHATVEARATPTAWPLINPFEQGLKPLRDGMGRAFDFLWSSEPDHASPPS